MSCLLKDWKAQPVGSDPNGCHSLILITSVCDHKCPSPEAPVVGPPVSASVEAGGVWWADNNKGSTLTLCAE